MKTPLPTGYGHRTLGDDGERLTLRIVKPTGCYFDVRFLANEVSRVAFAPAGDADGISRSERKTPPAGANR